MLKTAVEMLRFLINFNTYAMGCEGEYTPAFHTCPLSNYYDTKIRLLSDICKYNLLKIIIILHVFFNI